MACCLFGTIPLPEPVVTYCQLDLWKQSLVISFEIKTFSLTKFHLKMSSAKVAAILSLPQCVILPLYCVLEAPGVNPGYRLSHVHVSQHVGSMWEGLTHWGRVTHICISRLTIIGSDNGLSPGRRQAIIWTNARILLTGPLRTNFSEIMIEILTFSYTKMHLTVSSAKWRPFCLSLNVLAVHVKMDWPS